MPYITYIFVSNSLLIHAPKDDNKPKEVLEDDDDDRYLNTNTYRQYRKPKQWTERGWFHVYRN